MSTPKPPGTIRTLYLRWKSLRLPWRRQFLAGADLSGNTFWEFKDALNSNRLRRIVKYSRKSHYSEIVISPQWHQWLRHTRFEPPALEEQQYEVARQAQMKQLAARADERWAAKESFLDAPSKQQPQPAIGVRDPGGYASEAKVPMEGNGVARPVGTAEQVQAAVDGEEVNNTPPKVKAKREREEAPWAKADRRGGPGKEYAPQAWTPGPAARR